MVFKLLLSTRKGHSMNNTGHIFLGLPGAAMIKYLKPSKANSPFVHASQYRKSHLENPFILQTYLHSASFALLIAIITLPFHLFGPSYSRLPHTSVGLLCNR
jgi:hypothetical protein